MRYFNLKYCIHAIFKNMKHVHLSGSWGIKEYRHQAMRIGVCEILDGLVAIFSFGNYTGQRALAEAMKEVKPYNGKQWSK